MAEIGDRTFDEHRRIVIDSQRHPDWQRRLDIQQRLTHGLGHRHLIGAALLPDTDSHRALPVKAGERSLIDKAIFDLGDILQTYRMIGGATNHQHAKLIEPQGLTHDADIQLAPPMAGIFKISGWNFEMLAIECGGDLNHGDAIFYQSRIIKPDTHGAINRTAEHDIANPRHA